MTANSSNVNPKSHNLFKPRNTAAASLLPPARPAATGICFSILISTPFSHQIFPLIYLLPDKQDFFGHQEQTY